MPGMVEAHTHFSWNDQPSLDAIQRMPPEEHILWCAEVAKRYLDMGWTSCVGAAAAKPRLDVVIRNAINDGTIVGPRYLAASQEITVPGGLGDTTQPHLPQPDFAFGAIVSGAEEMRRCVRMFVKWGVDSLKINLSGESITGMPSDRCQFTDAEIATCVEEAKAWGKRVAAHARSCNSIKRCVTHGIEVIYHASFTDSETLDLLEAAQDGALHRARPGLADQHLPPRERVGPDARGDEEDGLPPRARGGGRDDEGAAQARRPHPARRRLRLRLDAARHQREGPRVLRQGRRHEHDGSAALGHRLGRADDEDGQGRSATCREGYSPTCCWSTATRSPTSRSCRTSRASCR